jgi:hypothetical protein
MSAAANWSYTARATIWKNNGIDEWGQPQFTTPVSFDCDYGGNTKTPKPLLSDAGREIVIKDTIWTEYSEARMGDYVLIGESTIADPIEAGADEVKSIDRYADTLERIADDYAIVTGV